MSGRSDRRRRGASPGPWPDGSEATLDVGHRTALAARLGTGWLWPRWLERQLDHGSRAFQPLDGSGPVTNVTTRSWTTIGNVGSSRTATVDPRGLVTPESGGWSLDWWVGAEDRWHLPSREAAVRQRLVDDAPVVETAMRVPGGDIVHRAYAIRTAPGDGAEELVVVELENATPVPVAVALAVRPYGPLGVAHVGHVEVVAPPPEGRRTEVGWALAVDGRIGVLLPKAPNRVATSTFDAGDVAEVVLRGDAGATVGAEHGRRCEVGLASGAVVYPLPHRARLVVLVPLAGPAGPRPPRRRRSALVAPAFPAGVPTAAQVANGWKAHGDQGLRLVLPDARLMALVAAGRRSLLAAHGAGDAIDDPAVDVRGVVAVLGALDRLGHRDEVAGVLATTISSQAGDGALVPASSSLGATGAVLHALGEHWRLHRDLPVVDDGVGPVVAAAVEWIERRRGAERGARPAPDPDGLLPAGPAADHVGPPGVHLADDLWSVRGLHDASDVLAALGELDAAAEVGVRAKHFAADVDAALAAAAARLGSAAMPATPTGPLDRRCASMLAATWPLRLLAGDDPRVAATAEEVRTRWSHGRAVVHPGGLDPLRSLALANVELAAGDRRAWERLEWLVSVATPTWTWPEVVHPTLDGGSGGDGHHLAVTAEALSTVRNLLVRETPDGGLALCSHVPDTWLGQQLEVHGAPTHHGTLSFAIRWHGDRPALLWELEPHDGAAGVRITAPGLDPTWSTTDLRGDALLAPVAPPEGMAVPEEEPPAPPAPAEPATPVRLSPRRRRDEG